VHSELILNAFLAFGLGVRLLFEIVLKDWRIFDLNKLSFLPREIGTLKVYDQVTSQLFVSPSHGKFILTTFLFP
jgi:hypothetical protein